jgi:hypothetical protein
MCVVGILVVLIFEHITFALLLPYVGHSTIHRDLECQNKIFIIIIKLGLQLHGIIKY